MPFNGTATLDKSPASYKPGDTMTLTVVTAAGARDKDTPIAVKVSAEGLGEVTLTGKVDRPPLQLVIGDSSRVWTLVSDDEVTAVYTAKA